MQILWPILAILLLVLPSGAQQTQPSAQGQQGPPRPDAPPNQQESPQNTTPPSLVILPAGTQLALILTHPINSKTMRRGDTVFAETTAPVFADNLVAIPAGAFVQGKVEKLTRQGSRARLLMQSVSVALPDGSVVNIKGPLEVTSGEGTAFRNPSDGAKAGAVLAPLIGMGLGTAIGEAAHTTQTTTFAGMTMTSQTLKGVTIGGITGLAAGTIASFVLVARSHHFYVGEGSPLEMTLPRPVTVASGQTAESARSTDQR
jgi:type IV secretory pathway VirB10-like protein